MKETSGDVILFKRLRHDDDGYMMLNGVYYSGAAEDHWPNGTRASLVHYRDGVQDGVMYGWHQNGVMSSETPYEMGCVRGICRKWYPNGQLKSEMEVGDRGYRLWLKEWDESGNLIRS